MAQAECMPDLMHDDLLDVGLRQRFGLRATHLDFAARFQQSECKPDFVRGLLLVIAIRMADVGRMANVLGHDLPRTACIYVGDGDVGIHDFAAARIDLRRPDRKADVGADEPAYRRMTRIERVECIGGGLLLHHDRILESDSLKRAIPFEYAFGNRLAIFFRDVFVQPVDDRLLRLGQCGGRILLFQTPAIHVVRRIGRCQIVGKVVLRRDEMPDPVVRQAWMHRLGRQRGKAVVEADEKIARIRGRGRHAGHRGTGRRGGWRRRDPRHKKMCVHLEAGQ